MILCHAKTSIWEAIPNSEEWYDKTTWFNWNRQRIFSTKCNIKIVKTEFYVKLHKISIRDWAVIQGDADQPHPTTLIEFSIILFNPLLRLKMIRFEKIESKKLELRRIRQHWADCIITTLLKPIWTGFATKIGFTSL